MVQRVVARILPLFQRETAKLARLKEGKEPKPPKINNEGREAGLVVICN